MKSILPYFAIAVLILFRAAPSGSRTHTNQPGFTFVQENSSAGSLVEALTAAEKQFWEAWKNKQPDRFGNAMADDAVFFGLYGVTGKSELVEEQRQSVTTCQVESYALTNLRVIPIDADSAILLYDAEQHAICGGSPVQPFMHGESVYARRNGRWLNLLRSEVPAADHQAARTR